MPAVILPEKTVVEIWRNYLPGRTDLVTEEGKEISIIYPGMLNGDRGADIVDAVINTDNTLLRGNVEIHVKSSGWWTHGHHEDPAYNNVVLHVVYRQDKKEAINLQNGITIPTLVLEKYLKHPVDVLSHHENNNVCLTIPCHRKSHLVNTEDIGEILDKAGDERFHNKVARFRERLIISGIHQALYEGLMESLGYAKNKEQMVGLARHLTLKRLETEVVKNTPSI